MATCHLSRAEYALYVDDGKLIGCHIHTENNSRLDMILEFAIESTKDSQDVSILFEGVG